MKNKLSLILATLIILLGSCASQKKVPYMIDAETIPQEALDKIAANNEPRVMPGDILEITVMSYNIDAVRPFNRSSFVTELTRTTSNYNNDTNRNTYYIVDDNGDIEFPVIGKLRIGGMNKSQIQELICSEIYPKYITERPGIDVRFKNFKVSVIGEVRSPGVTPPPTNISISLKLSLLPATSTSPVCVRTLCSFAPMPMESVQYIASTSTTRN